MRLSAVIAIGLSFALSQTFGNNIQVANVTMTGQNTGSQYTYVQFDLSWDNSWNLSTGPNNWDAAWVFVKFQITGGSGCTASTLWNHATLSTVSADMSVGNNNSVPVGITAESDGKGVFIYRNTAGSGSNLWQSVKLKWNYGTDGVGNLCTVTVKVFAVEMVYVPAGSFYCGDGVVPGNGRFESGASGTPFQVTSAATPSTLGGGGAGSLGNNSNGGMVTVDDFSSTGASQALPASFPNGYNNFYCMKYEISQHQYYEFLNTLTGTQQTNRTPATTVGWYHANAGGFTTPQSRNGVKCQTAPVGATSGVYGCDLNNNGIFNEVSADGMYLAMNFLSGPDLLAYLDWSGLRPMSELELEKACRGSLIPVAGEFAWGTNVATAVASVTNAGANNEISATANANINYNNLLTGPARCGIFANGSSTRVLAGASYWGIMELSGNVWENEVGLGSAAGRSFTGIHGNGSLNAAGFADVNYWPGINGNNTLGSANATYGGVTGCSGYAGLGFAAGTFNTTSWATVSDRQYRTGWGGLTGRDGRNGGRGVRIP